MAYDQAKIGVKIAHLIVRDQLSVCRYFASKVEFENEIKTQEKETTKEKKRNNKFSNKKATSTFDDEEYDEMFEETPSREIFFEDEDDRYSNEGGLNDSVDSMGQFMTEQAFNNNLEGSISIIERSGRLLKQIYIELLRIIKPLEKEQSQRTKSKKNYQADLEHLESPNPSSNEEENEEELLANATERKRAGGQKEKKADMRHILGFLN